MSSENLKSETGQNLSQESDVGVPEYLSNNNSEDVLSKREFQDLPIDALENDLAKAQNDVGAEKYLLDSVEESKRDKKPMKFNSFKDLAILKSDFANGDALEEKLDDSTESSQNESDSPEYEGSESTKEEGADSVNEEPKVTVGKGEFEIVDSERAEHIRLRQEMEIAQQELNEAIANDNSPRALSMKFFGIGRQNLRQELKEKEDNLIAAKGNYIRNDRKSRDYSKIANRLNREKNQVEIEKLWTAESLDQKYHFLNTVDKRLELQTSKSPEWFERSKNNLMEGIKKNKKVAYTVGGLSLLALAPASLIASVGMAAGIGTSVGLRYFGGKKIEDTREQRKKEIGHDSFKEGGEISDSDVRKTMSTLLSVEDEAQRKSTALKYGSRVAGVFAGGATAYGLHDYLVENGISSGGFTRVYQVAKSYFDNFVPSDLGSVSSPDILDGVTSDNFVPDNLPIGDMEVVSENVLSEEISVPETSQVMPEVETESPLTPESPTEIEHIHEVKPGENLSTILFNSIKERIATGEITLPPGVSREELAHYMYQSFPEMTRATDISPRLTAEEWINLGVESGNPHLIKPGENINIQVLLEKMWGSSLESNPTNLGGSEVTPEILSNANEVINAENSAAIEIPENSLPVADEERTVVSETASVPKRINVEDFEGVTLGEGGIPESEVSLDTTTVDSSVETVKEIPLEEFYRISPGYEQYVTRQFVWGESMHKYLADMIEEGVRKGDIALPLNVTSGENDFSKNIMGLVEKRLPEVSSSIFDKNPDVLTPEQWKEMGISSGNPRDISSTDVFKPGKLFEYIVSGNKEVLLSKTQ